MLQAVDDASCYLPEKLQSEWIDVTKDVHCTVKQANVMHDSEEDCMLGYASLVEDGAKFSHSCLEASLLLFLPAVMKFSHCLEEGELGCVGFFFPCLRLYRLLRCTGEELCAFLSVEVFKL